MDYKKTAFLDKEYDYDPATCMRKRYLKEDNTKAVVFTRIVPEGMMAKNLACFTQDICTGSMGKVFHGKRCCRKINKNYKAYEKDIFNLMSLEKDSGYPKTEIPKHFKGNIARVFLYMQEQYQLKLSTASLNQYKIWDKEDRVDEKECEIYHIIYKIQGRENPWIKSACETLLSKSSKSSQE
ncbi:endonuclease [Sulfurimonas sp. MAG313]|nr:endonuclease [Sulfurimonas sp. MAG313]MDF1881794.1 endonuclease [Sulfurimonas sp. MAG313]